MSNRVSPPPVNATDILRRLVDFENRLIEGCTTRRVLFRWGVGLFNDEVPNKFDLNFLRVDGAPHGVTARGLMAEAERLMSPLGLDHRRVTIDDAVLAERIRPGLEKAGWRTTRFLWMIHTREPHRRARRGTAREVDLDTHLAVKEVFNRREPHVSDDDLADQLLRSDRLLERATHKRAFIATRRGVAASICEMYSDGAIAQIEDVATLKEERGKGLGTAVVLEALEAARAAGHETIFIVADADDWPKDMYARLGFEPIGVTFQFIRWPEGLDPQA